MRQIYKIALALMIGLISGAAMPQTVPTTGAPLNLALPVPSSPGWNIPINANFTSINQFASSVRTPAAINAALLGLPNCNVAGNVYSPFVLGCIPNGSGGGGGGGSVTSVGATGLSVLFNVSVVNPNTTPVLNFSQVNAIANSVFGNFTNGLANPTFSSSPVFSAANLTNFPTFNQSTTGNAATASAFFANPTLCSTGFSPTGILANGNAVGCQAVGGGGGGLPTAPGYGYAPISSGAGTTYTAQTVALLAAGSANQFVTNIFATQFDAEVMNDEIHYEAAPSTCNDALHGTHTTKLNCAYGRALHDATIAGNFRTLVVNATWDNPAMLCEPLVEPSAGFYGVNIRGPNGQNAVVITASTTAGCSVAGQPMLQKTAGSAEMYLHGITFNANNVASQCWNLNFVNGWDIGDIQCLNTNPGLLNFTATSDGTTSQLTNFSGSTPAVGNFIMEAGTTNQPVTVASISGTTITTSGKLPTCTGCAFTSTTVDSVASIGSTALFAEDGMNTGFILAGGPYQSTVTEAALIIGSSGTGVTSLTCSSCGNYGSGIKDMQIYFVDTTAACTVLPKAHVSSMPSTSIVTMTVDDPGQCSSFSGVYAQAYPSLQIPYGLKMTVSDSNMLGFYSSVGQAAALFFNGGNNKVIGAHVVNTPVGIIDPGNNAYTDTECDTIGIHCFVFNGTEASSVTGTNSFTHVNRKGYSPFYFGIAASPVAFTNTTALFQTSIAGFNAFTSAAGVVTPCGTNWPADASTVQSDKVKALTLDCVPDWAVSGALTLGTPLAVTSGGTGTTTPALVAGTNVTITGTWPNQTINSTGGSGGSGTVTHTAGALTALQLVIGNAAADIKVDTGASTDGVGNLIVASETTTGTTQGAKLFGVGTGTITLPTGSPTNYVGIIGPPSGSPTYLLQLPSANPAGQVQSCATPSAVNGLSQSVCTWLTNTGTGSDVRATSPTLVTPVLGAATATSLLATGNVDGTAPVTITTGTTATLGGTFRSGYTFNQEATAATAVAYTLPTAAAGLQYCVGNSWNGTAATTGVLTVNTSATGQFIIWTDGTLSATGGNVTSGGAASDAACFVGVDATHWQAYVSRGSWTKH